MLAPIIAIISLSLFFVIASPNVYAQSNTTPNIVNDMNTAAAATTATVTPLAQTIADQTPIASDQSVDNTTAAVVGTGTALAGGIATVFGKLQNDKKKINNALRRIDKEQKDTLDAMNLIVERGGLDINKDKTFFQLLNEQVIPGSGVNTLKLGQNWHVQYEEYVDWYEGRYSENKD